MLRNLLRSKRKSTDINQNLPNLLEAVGTAMFTSQDVLKQIKKLKISQQDLWFMPA